MCTNADADIVYQSDNNTPINSFDDNDIVINHGAVVNAADASGIIMNDYVYLYNNGTINGSINTNGNNLFIYNTGVMSGTIINDTGGNVTQIMRNQNEITDIDVVGNNFFIEIDNIGNLNFDDIKNMDATSFRIKNTSILVNDFNDWQNWNQNITLEGALTLIINDYETITDGDVVNNVTAGNHVSVHVNNLDSLHKIQLSQNGQDIVLHVVRETDYDKVTAVDNDTDNNDNGDNTDTGHVLKQIRNTHPNDKLLQAIDSADTNENIVQIKNKSSRFNHGLLLKPLEVIDNLAMSDIVKNETDFGMGFRPFYVMSDDVKVFGGRVYFGHNYKDLYFNAGMNFNRFDYKDDLNDFYGYVYGTDINIKKYFNNLWVNGITGLNLVKYHTDYVSKDNEIKNNPVGLSWYADIDMGYDFSVVDNISIAPFVGTGYQYRRVADVSYSDLYLRSGAIAKYAFTTDGIKYEYSFGGGINTDNVVFTNAKVGFWSDMDKAGIDCGLGILKDDAGYYYQISLSAKMLF